VDGNSYPPDNTNSLSKLRVTPNGSIVNRDMRSLVPPQRLEMFLVLSVTTLADTTLAAATVVATSAVPITAACARRQWLHNASQPATRKREEAKKMKGIRPRGATAMRLAATRRSASGTSARDQTRCRRLAATDPGARLACRTSGPRRCTRSSRRQLARVSLKAQESEISCRQSYHPGELANRRCPASPWAICPLCEGSRAERTRSAY